MKDSDMHICKVDNTLCIQTTHQNSLNKSQLKPLTNGEIHDQIEAVLRSIEIYSEQNNSTTNALALAEFCSLFEINPTGTEFNYDSLCDLHDGEFTVLTKFGSCEGECITIFVQDCKYKNHRFASIKYITGDIDLVGQIGIEIYKAFWRSV